MVVSARLIAGVVVAGLLAGAQARAEPAAPCQSGLPRYEPRALVFPTGAAYVTADKKIRITGYNDMTEMLTAISALFTAAHPEIAFELVLKGTRTAPPALARGESALAPMGAEFSDAEMAEYLKAQGREPLLISVAHDSLNPQALSSPTAIYVHRSNPMTQVSIDAARRVFTQSGEAAVITWGDLGVRGELAGQPIHVHGFDAETAIGMFVRRHKFGGRPYIAGLTPHPKSKGVVEALGGDPLAIGFANLNHATADVRALALAEHEGGPYVSGTREAVGAGIYPLDRKLLIYLRLSADGGADPVAAEYVRLMLSCNGQDAIARGTLGYIPLSAAEAEAERGKVEQAGARK